MRREAVVIGHAVSPTKRDLSKELRRRMTPEEAILWRMLRTNRARGFHFRRQQVIAGFVADFYCHTAKLVIEVDGGIHDQHAEYDAERDCVLEARGLRP